MPGHLPRAVPHGLQPASMVRGAPLLLLRTLLGLEPHGNDLVVNPFLPEGIHHIELLNIPGRWGTTNGFARDTTSLRTRQRLHPPLGGA